MRLATKWKGLFMLGGAFVATALAAPVAESADHKDAPATIADPASDINDVFSFVDGSNVVFAMTVTPFAGATAKFSDKTQYVFHSESQATFGATTTTKVDIICTFDTAQKISCWVGTADFVTGDAKAEAGISSTSGKVKVFAGMRSDPFFFNLQGFKDVVSAVEAAAAGTPALVFDGSGCPTLNATTSGVLIGKLKETTSTAAPSKTTADDFATANTLAIVLSVDKALVTKGGPIMSVWASTNKAP